MKKNPPKKTKKGQPNTRVKKCSPLESAQVADFFKRRQRGESVHGAALLSGVHRNNLDRWVKHARAVRAGEVGNHRYATHKQLLEFLALWEGAPYAFETYHLNNIESIATGQSDGKWEASKWLLAIANPDRYSLKQKQEITHNDPQSTALITLWETVAAHQPQQTTGQQNEHTPLTIESDGGEDD